jgi:predicted nucleic acid-binding protein
MTVHYFDPSAWVKRHFQEPGSAAVNALFSIPVDAACCRLGVLEMLATVARKCSQTSVERTVVDAIIDNIRADFAAFRVVPLDELRIVAATELAVRHRLRAMDALHLASALAILPLGEVVMVSADAELLAAAAREGIATLNPALPPV